MIMRKVGFVGAGVMAEALARGMFRADAASPSSVYASDPSEERRRIFAGMILRANVLQNNLRLVEACRVIVLSVKPNIVPDVAREIRTALSRDHLVVSVAAGVTLARLRGLLQTDRLVRIMPNTPALVGQAASAYCPAAGATAEDAALVEEMLRSVGLCVRVEESLMDAVTGLSGSGPAYVYLAVEALAEGGVREGLSRDTALRLAAQTVLGAAKMVIETGKDPARLREEVTTPGGTTEEGLAVLEEANFRRALVEAVAAAAERSRRMGTGR